MNQRKIWSEIRKNPACLRAGILAAAAVMCFISLYMYDNGRAVETNEEGQKVLERSEAGKDASYDMEVSVGEYKEKVDVTVSARKYSDEELQQVFADAGEQLDELILGSNSSLDEVRTDLNLITEIPDTGISVYWELDDYGVMDVQGKIRESDLTEEGTLIRLTAVMNYGEHKAARELYARVYPPVLSAEEQTLAAIRELTEASDEETKSEKYMILPDQVNGEKVVWKYEKNTRAFAVLLIGAGASCMLLVSESQRRKENEKKMIRQLHVDYPQIINKFNLYIRAGMTIRRAWFLIVKDYEKKKKTSRKAYEEMAYTMNQINGGMPEGEAYEEYGNRCKIAAYRKFGTMLAQNLRKGSKGLAELLEREAEEAFEDRRNLAKKLGEEAGTKLMIPMFMMLIIVFAIVIVPAFFSIQI